MKDSGLIFCVLCLSIQLYQHFLNIMLLITFTIPNVKKEIRRRHVRTNYMKIIFALVIKNISCMIFQSGETDAALQVDISVGDKVPTSGNMLSYSMIQTPQVHIYRRDIPCFACRPLKLFLEQKLKIRRGTLCF